MSCFCRDLGLEHTVAGASGCITSGHVVWQFTGHMEVGGCGMNLFTLSSYYSSKVKQFSELQIHPVGLFIR